MGEKAHLPNENSLSKENGENMEQDENEEENEDDLNDLSPEEFQMLDNQLDALNMALDDIEQKNDNIHAQLLELLQSNREIRQQMQGSPETESSEAKKQN